MVVAAWVCRPIQPLLLVVEGVPAVWRLWAFSPGLAQYFAIAIGGHQSELPSQHSL